MTDSLQAGRFLAYVNRAARFTAAGRPGPEQLRGIFTFIEGVTRWHNRVAGYAFTLVTDQYPPFRLKP